MRYISARDAITQLRLRQEDGDLAARVLELLGGRLPAGFPDDRVPTAMLARYVPRATGEDLAFATSAAAAGMRPYWASYVSDRFTTRNPEKVDTLRPPVRLPKGQRTRSWIVPPSERNAGVGLARTGCGHSATAYHAEFPILGAAAGGTVSGTRQRV